MKKINVLFILFILLSLSNCLGKGNYTKKGQRESWNKFIQSNSSDNWIIIKQGNWEYNKWGTKYIWDKNYNIFNSDTNIITSSSLPIDRTEKSYECIEKYGTDKLMYVGKWQYYNKIGRKIRLIACGFRAEYESMDEKNKKIPFKPLTLYRPIKRGGLDLEAEEIALIKWHNKYGYNAVYNPKTGQIETYEEKNLSDYERYFYAGITSEDLEIYSKAYNANVIQSGSDSGYIGNQIVNSLSAITSTKGMRNTSQIMLEIGKEPKKVLFLVPEDQVRNFYGTVKALDTNSLSNLKGYVWLMDRDKKHEKLEQQIQKISNGNLKVEYGSYIKNN